MGARNTTATTYFKKIVSYGAAGSFGSTAAISAMIGLAGTANAGCDFDNNAGVRLNCQGAYVKPGTVSATGGYKTRAESAAIGETLPTGGSGNKASIVDQGKVNNTGGANGHTVDPLVAKVVTCAPSVNDTFAGGLPNSTADYQPFSSLHTQSRGFNVPCE